MVIVGKVLGDSATGEVKLAPSHVEHSVDHAWPPAAEHSSQQPLSRRSSNSSIIMDEVGRSRVRAAGVGSHAIELCVNLGDDGSPIRLK